MDGFDLLKCYQIYTWLFTYTTYVILHCARKPLTIVRNVLHVEDCKACSFPPFDSSNAKTLFGWLDYGFLLPYAVGMIFFSHITRGYKVTHVLAFFTSIAGVLAISFGLGRYFSIHVYLYYFGIQFFSGLAMSTGWPCLIEVITNWVGKNQRGFVLGVWNSHSHIGNALGTLIAGYYLEVNWGLSFIVPGVITLIFGLLIWRFMYEAPKDVGFIGDVGLTDTFPHEKNLEHVALSDIFGIPCFFCYLFCCFFVKMNGYILLYWLPSYIYSSSTGGLTPNQAGTMSTFYDFGSIFGCVFSGVLLDRYGKGPFICLIQLLACFPVVVMFSVVPISSYYVSAGHLFVIGMLVNGTFGLLVTAIAADLGNFYKIRQKPGAISVVSSFIDGVGSLGAAFGPLLAGFLASYSWKSVFSLILSSLILSLIALVKPSLYSLRKPDF